MCMLGESNGEIGIKTANIWRHAGRYDTYAAF